VFQASAAVRTAKTDSAVAESSTNKRIRTDKVSDEELANTKALYNGSFALGLEDPARTANFASTILSTTCRPTFINLPAKGKCSYSGRYFAGCQKVY